MKQAVDRNGSLFGNAFRATFALAMFKKMVREIEHGADILRKNRDADSKMVDANLKKYHDGMDKFSAIFAKLVAPTLGVIGEAMESFAEKLQFLLDVADAIMQKGDTKTNFDRIRAERA